MSKLFAGALVVAMFGAAGTASAADIPATPVHKAPIVAPPYLWTGFYVGVHAGYGFGRSAADVTLVPVNATFRPFTLHTDPRGFIGGAQAGYSWQHGMYVLGFETDLSFADLKGDDSAVPISALTGQPLQNPNQPSISQANEQLKLFGTVRARLGVTATDRVLAYLTSGLAYAQIDNAAATRFFIPSGNVFTGSDSAIRAGWTAGAGLEWALAASWSLKAEYLYYDLGAHTLFTRSLITSNPITDTFHDKGNIVRAGVNFRFAPDAIVARY
jgi:outer membrane immunogenic protein